MVDRLGGRQWSLANRRLCALLAMSAIVSPTFVWAARPPESASKSELQSQVIQGPSQNIGCSVTQETGRAFVDKSVNSCAEYYPSAHDCSAAPELRPGVCKNLDMFKAVEWGFPDMIINTHRGIWALTLQKDAARDITKVKMKVGGFPENSYGGVWEARWSGFRSIEYDIFLMRDDVNHNSGAVPIVNHFTDLRGFTNYSGPQIYPTEGIGGTGFTMTTQWDHWSGANSDELTLRDRAGELPDVSSTRDQFLSVKQFLEAIQEGYPDTVVVFDPKFARELYMNQPAPSGDGGLKAKCIGFCGAYPKSKQGGEVVELIQFVVTEAKSQGMLSNIVIKVPELEGLDADILKNNLGDEFNRILWAPQPDAGGRMPMEDVMHWIERWQQVAQPNGMLFWDTTIRSHENWMGRPFAWQGEKFADLMDYFAKKSKLRASIWTPDPAGPGGRHGNFADSWNQYGNDGQDMRGDILYNLSYSKSTNAIISSDRPDQILYVRNALVRDANKDAPANARPEQ